MQEVLNAARVGRLASALCAVLVVAVAIVAAGCGGDDSPSGSVRLLVFGDPPEIEAYRTLIRAFEEEEPDIDVQLVEASDRDDLIARLSTSFAGGSPPDLFLMNYRFYGQSRQGRARAGRGLRERLNKFELDDFYPEAVDAFRWDGGSPACRRTSRASSSTTTATVQASRRAGAKADGQWVAVRLRAQQLTAKKRRARRSGERRPSIYGLGVEPAIIRFAPFVWSNGGELVDDEENPTQFTLDTPAARMRWRSSSSCAGRRGHADATRRSRRRMSRRGSSTGAWGC